MKDSRIQAAYDLAKQQYADLGVDAAAALKTLATIPITIQCWQGDDVGGFEAGAGEIGGGLAATGNYPGKARTADVVAEAPSIVYRLTRAGLEKMEMENPDVASMLHRLIVRLLSDRVTHLMDTVEALQH